MARFDTWLALPAQERKAWLAALHRDDPLLHGCIASLISADEEAAAQAFLQAPAAPRADVNEAALAGRRLGPWQLERQIGSGGMGQVWLARRTDGLYEGQAAIKLLRLALADTGANARFAREGRLLGRLSHPHIARLLDAGATESGERYLVLEYVNGERIDHYCDQHQLSVAQRLALFIVVCEAVTHAHENLVVHRDLKPSNIFVTQDGQVKLLDFGVAKLLADDMGQIGDLSEITRSAGAAMTPQYASPEQLNGGTVTTATDVYGLGLVLYGLLSGARPFARPMTPEPRSRLVDEAKPLWALTDDTDDLRRIAAQRATSVAALRKMLHADVAVVVGKALKADPAERYRSVPDFAADLQRTLDSQPISAQPDTWVYRGSKFVRRHGFGVGAAALIAIAVLVGAAGTLVKQREAQREAERAVAVKRFMLDLFEQARSSVKPDGTQTREATLNDLLVAGAARVSTSFALQPSIRDEVFQILVELYSDTGSPDRTITLARQRLAAAQQGFGAQDVRSAPAEVMLGAVLLNFGQINEARPLLNHAQLLFDQAADHTSIERARLLRWQGYLDRVSGIKPPWAENRVREAVELLRARYPNEDDLLSALAQMPSVACGYGLGELAMASSEELRQRTIARYGVDNLFVDEATHTRGQLLLLNGRFTEALPTLQTALAGFRRHVGDKSPNVLVAQFNVAEAYDALGRGEDSARELAAARAALARDHATDSRLARMLGISVKRIEQRRAGQFNGCKG